MYNVSVSPHVRSQNTTKSVMRDVAIALLPVLAFGVYQFGLRAGNCNMYCYLCFK